MDRERRSEAVRRWEEWKDFFAITSVKPDHYRNDYIRDIKLLTDYIAYLQNELEDFIDNVRNPRAVSWFFGLGVGVGIGAALTTTLAYFIG